MASHDELRALLFKLHVQSVPVHQVGVPGWAEPQAAGLASHDE